eukprot:CAMPEP_0196727194 /NCGR_PEP_ID=MMETSP1091-20130531/8244_1 /TAXON_ID=302021 /ORGANISM="Rhodomonas sp., Strain CCMP768" /LENGTH=169 /DNA_ID=CAMNT_0042069747 /DNA_START=40 /DNA_END=546 /DNA_ORIENTATION=-
MRPIGRPTPRASSPREIRKIDDAEEDCSGDSGTEPVAQRCLLKLEIPEVHLVGRTQTETQSCLSVSSRAEDAHPKMVESAPENSDAAPQCSLPSFSFHAASPNSFVREDCVSASSRALCKTVSDIVATSGRNDACEARIGTRGGPGQESTVGRGLSADAGDVLGQIAEW